MHKKALSPTFLAVAAAGALSLASGRAEAGIFEFTADIYGGGLYGTPSFGFVSQDTSNPNAVTTGQDFYVNQSGGLLGGRLGIELLNVDLYAQFDQYFNGTGAAGSAVNLMLGVDGTLGCSAGTGCWGLILGAYGGGVFGFPYTPKLPIDKSQIAGYGIAAEGVIGAEYRFTRNLLFQATGTVGYHYLFAGAREITIDPMTNDVRATTTHGFHLLGKLGLRFRIGT